MDAIALGCLTAIGSSGRLLSRRVLLWSGWLGAALLIFSLEAVARLYSEPMNFRLRQRWREGRTGGVETAQ
jgi:hypothetical protein